MADDEVAYETKTIRAVRGTEALTVSKWEKEGWEVVSRNPGTLRTEITVRRPKSRSRVLLYAIGGGVFALVLAAIITIRVINERSAPAAEAEVAPTTTAIDREAPPTETESSTPAAEDPIETTVITGSNTPEFAAILGLTDYCDPTIPAFAAKYSGQTISFDGNVGALSNHDSYDTRYDILIGVGDYSETAQQGPAFQFRDVNLTSDLYIVGNNPGSIGVGSNLGVVAEVGDYQANSCLFMIEPLETSFR